MDQVMKVIDGILASLDNLERPLEVLLITAILLLERRLKQNTAAITPSVPVEQAPKVKTTNVNRQKELQSEMEKGLALYFSGKSPAEMSEDEKALYDKVVAYFGG